MGCHIEIESMNKTLYSHCSSLCTMWRACIILTTEAEHINPTVRVSQSRVKDQMVLEMATLWHAQSPLLPGRFAGLHKLLMAEQHTIVLNSVSVDSEDHINCSWIICMREGVYVSLCVEVGLRILHVLSSGRSRRVLVDSSEVPFEILCRERESVCVCVCVCACVCSAYIHAYVHAYVHQWVFLYCKFPVCLA